MKKSWWKGTDRLVGWRALRGGKKSPHRKCERRLTVENLEVRKLLSATVNVQPASVNAGEVGTLVFTLDGEITAPATVDFTVTDGTAVQGTDYFVPPGTTITFQPGQTEPDTVPVFTSVDASALANKSFAVSIANATGELSLGASQQAVYTIFETTLTTQAPLDGDPMGPAPYGGDSSAPTSLSDGLNALRPRPMLLTPTVSISGPGTVNEGSAAYFLVSISQPTSVNVAVSYTTQDGSASAGLNYTAASGWATIPAGNSTAWISVNTIDDGVYEGNQEYFTLALTSATGAILPSGTTASAGIQNIDSAPIAGISNAARVSEGANASFQLTLSRPANSAITVYYHTVNGTASAGVNYTSASSSAVVSAGATSAWVPVSTIDDGVYENNDEFFYLGLTSASGGPSVPSGTSASAGIHNTDLPTANQDPPCSCTPTSDVAGQLMTDMTTIPGGGDFSSPNAYGPDAKIGQPAQLATNSSEAAVTRQDGGVQVWNLSAGSYTATNPVTQGTLVAGSNSYGNDFVETDPDGTQWIFAGSGASGGYAYGKLEKIIPPSGSGTVTYAYSTNQWTATTQTSANTAQVATYTTNSSGKVTAESVVNWSGSTQTAVSSASLTYYTAGASGGGAGDLKLIQTYDSSNQTGSVINTTYYRYYKGNYVASSTKGFDANANAGLPDQVKFTVSGADLRRLTAAYGSNLDNITDAQLAPYADDYYKYTSGGLIQEIDAAGAGCSNCGGEGASTFTYAYSGSTNLSPNVWNSETVETRGDGSTVTTFDNFQRQTILKVTWNGASGSGSQHSMTYNVYDSNANLTYAYQPSAMTGVSAYSFDGTTLSMSPNTTTGLVAVYQYYSATNAPEYPTDGSNPSSGGGVLGYLQLAGVQQGSTGTPVWQSKTDYVKKTVNSNVVYYPYDSTQFADTTYNPGDGTGGNPRTTTDHYTFLTGTSVPAVASVTAVLPAVSTTQHGSAAAATSQVVYDNLGRAVWTMDALGSIGYTQYDPATGAVVTRIQDVNTNGTGFTGLPTGWSNTTGKHLVTTYVVDSQGRTTKETDPDGDVTYTVYNDANHEVRVYHGWHQNASSQWLPTGPVSDFRSDTTGNYSESLAYSWDNVANLQGSSYLNGDGSPKGGELVTNANVTIQSLSRSILDYTGQVVQSLQYVNFTGTSYSTSTAAFGTAGSNYVETDYSYDPMGRTEAKITPAGQMSFTVYDGFGQVAAQWAGTTTATTPAARSTVISGFRNSGNNTPTSTAVSYSASGVQLYKTSSNVYDVDGNVTATTAYVDSNSAHNRTTTVGYDWRDRLTYVVRPADVQSRVVYTMTTYDNLGETTETQRYQYEGSNLQAELATQKSAGTPGKLDSSDLRLSQSTSLYDALGEVYQTSTYQIDSSGGVITNETQTTNYWYDPDGNQVATEDPASNGTIWAYNGLGQETQSTQGQILSSSSPWAFNHLAQASGQSRSFEVYVHFTSTPASGWQNAYSVSDSGGTPTFTRTSGTTPLGGGWYDLGTVTLASNDNSAAVTVSQSSGTVPDLVCLGYSDQFSYFANGQTGAGRLYEHLDRNGRATTYQYDTIGRVTGESWYATSTLQNPTETISYAYNSAGLLQSATDQTSSTTATDSYTYDMAGEVKTDTQSVPGLMPSVVLSEIYTNGNRSELDTAIGGTNDFSNSYLYQGPMGQMSQAMQWANGGNAVATKTGTFGYDYLGEFSSIWRLQDLGASVAQASYGYDAEGNLTSLVYSKTGSTLPSYAWTYDALGNMASSAETIGALVNESVSYTNDSTGQLGSATSTGGPPSESYSYDSNGNRTNPGYAAGPNNELLADGTYTYSYDAEGNRTVRWVASGTNETQPGVNDTNITTYAWDNRNRLTSVKTYSTYTKYNAGTPDQTVGYIYDSSNRWISETITPATGTVTQTRFVYDRNQIVMQFDGTGTGALAASNLSHRYLWGPAVDQLLADEQVTNGLGQEGNVVWTLGDNLNTVRDLATYDRGTYTTTVVNHRVFSAYGQLESETIPGGGSATVTSLFAYTGRALDRATGLQNNLNRWYDAVTGRWLSEDPIGFAGGDANVYRYCGNGPTAGIDPSGMAVQDEAVLAASEETGHTNKDTDNPWPAVIRPIFVDHGPTYWSDRVRNLEKLLYQVQERKEQARSAVKRERDLEILLQQKRTNLQDECGPLYDDLSLQIKESRAIQNEWKAAFDFWSARVKQVEAELEAAKHQHYAPPAPPTIVI